MSSSENREKREVLKQYFGYDSFREGQDVVIDAILAGKDAFAVMPTGAGKSLCYQIPALIFGGITLVISPLISLMKDQVTQLNEVGIYAAFLNSSLTQNQYFKALEYAENGKYKIIYVAPERLLTESFLHFAMKAKIDFVAVDEVHCVSQWGQDFRPSYLKITEFIDRLSKRPVVGAFTATATEAVKKDVLNILKLKDPFQITTGFDRPNLYFEVRSAASQKEKYGMLTEYIRQHPDQNGIVYCISRKLVEELTDKLRSEGVSVRRYHAGLSDSERRKNQEDFIFDRCRVMVATNAFGMGIDKSDVRYVIHYNMPKDMESYYQEAGRAGRDSAPAECILFYSGQDVRTNEFLINHDSEQEELSEETVREVQLRARERLRQMTYYCFTNDCLREYMLKYFGEYQNQYCGNCKNCLTGFEEVDITDAVSDILFFIQDTGEHFGQTVIIDTLHGSNTERIRQFHLDRNQYYQKQKALTVVKLRKIMNFLLVDGEIELSKGEYPVVLLTAKGEKMLFDSTSANRKPVVTKFPKEQEKKITKIKKPSAIMETLDYSAGDGELYDRLRALRMEIATKHKVPAYVIFTDKTILQMSTRRPVNKEEMLSISGVAEMKYEKYGKIFLQEIKQFIDQSPKATVKVIRKK